MVKSLAANAGDTRDVGLILGLERAPAVEVRVHVLLAWKIPWIEETGRLQAMGS